MMENKGANGLGMAVSLAGALVGVVASRFFGLMLLIPVGMGLVLLALLMRFGPRETRPLVPGVSLMWGHTGWVLIGLTYLGRPDLVTYAEVAFYAIAGVFLLRRPSLAWVGVVTVLEGVSLVLNALQIATVDDRSMRLALLLHVGLRICVMVALLQGWRRFRQESLEEAEAAPVSVPPGSWTRCARCGLGHRARVEGTCPKCGTLYGQGASVAPVKPAATFRSNTLQVLLVSAVASVAAVGFGARSGLFQGKGDPRRSEAVSAPPPAPPRRTVKGTVRLVGEESPGAIELRVGGRRTPVKTNGQFEVNDPPAGSLTVHAASKDTVEGEVSVQVEVSEQGQTVVPDIALTPLGRMQGRVTFEQGLARPGEITVEVDGVEFRNAVDEQGRFAIERIRAGEHTLRVTARNFQPVSRTVAVRWRHPAQVDLPPLQPLVNANGCTPTARRVGPTSRDLVGTSDVVRADGKRDWLFYLEPCREGLVRRILLTDRGMNRGWDTEAHNPHPLLGVARSRSPDTLLNEVDSGEASIEVEAGQRLLLYLGQEPVGEQGFSVLLEYADGSVDQAETGHTP